MTTAPTPHEAYAAKARQRFGRLTPFRLGMEVGLAGDFLPAPYPQRSHAERNYYEGVRHGGDMLARQIERKQQEEKK